MPRPRLSAALIVRDEERHLGACLQSLRRLVDEVVVVDTGSRDASISIARRHGARVFRRPWRGDFAAARNAALERARGDWILYIDADERVTAGGRRTIAAAMRDPACVAARVLLHPRPGHTAYRELRLVRNHPEIRFRGVIHENLWPAVDRLRRVGGTVAETQLVLEHHGYEGDQGAKHRRNLPLLRRSLARDPGRVFDWCHLASVYAGLGKSRLAEHAWTSAVRVVRRTTARDASASLAYVGLVEWTAARGDDVRALLDEALACFPANLHLLWLDARERMNAGRWDDAVTVLERLRTLVRRGTYDDAVAYDARLLDAWPLEALALCHFRRDDYGRGARLFALAAARDPARVDLRAKRDLCRQRARTASRPSRAVSRARSAARAAL